MPRDALYVAKEFARSFQKAGRFFSSVAQKVIRRRPTAHAGAGSLLDNDNDLGALLLGVTQDYGREGDLIFNEFFPAIGTPPDDSRVDTTLTLDDGAGTGLNAVRTLRNTEQPVVQTVTTQTTPPVETRTEEIAPLPQQARGGFFSAIRRGFSNAARGIYNGATSIAQRFTRTVANPELERPLLSAQTGGEEERGAPIFDQHPATQQPTTSRSPSENYSLLEMERSYEQEEEEERAQALSGNQTGSSTGIPLTPRREVQQGQIVQEGPSVDGPEGEETLPLDRSTTGTGLLNDTTGTGSNISLLEEASSSSSTNSPRSGPTETAESQEGEDETTAEEHTPVIVAPAQNRAVARNQDDPDANTGAGLPTPEAGETYEESVNAVPTPSASHAEILSRMIGEYLGIADFSSSRLPALSPREYFKHVMAEFRRNVRPIDAVPVLNPVPMTLGRNEGVAESKEDVTHAMQELQAFIEQQVQETGGSPLAVFEENSIRPLAETPNANATDYDWREEVPGYGATQ